VVRDEIAQTRILFLADRLLLAGDRAARVGHLE
jgi:hypothetical protein